ncbi:MAG: zf-HC2 domain-containing protein [Lachnospiraceae bacterium]|nr:zf-HC2 domain-containing protein [Lachnospiraceae bacterium]
MSEKIPCSMVRDLAPLYAEKLTSAETRGCIEAHLESCEDCAEHYAALTKELECEDRVQKELQNTEIDYMKKIHDFQRSNLILGAVVSFLLGSFLPAVRVGFHVLPDGRIPDYFLARFQIAWPFALLKMLEYGALVCAVYLMVSFILKRRKMK